MVHARAPRTGAKRLSLALRAAVALAALGTIAAGGADEPAQRAGPWVPAGAAPLPGWARSARALHDDQPLFDAPGAKSRRRGSVARGADLPVYAAREAEGCAARWLQVGPAAWICEEAAELSADGPNDARARTWRDMPDGLPFRYYFVGPDGSFGYRRVESADVGEPDMQLEPGFAVAIVEERAEGGARYGRTHRNYWVPMRDLGPVHGFAFRGADVPNDAAEIPFAWVVTDKARLQTRAGGAFSATGETRARFELVPALEEAQTFGGRFLRVAGEPPRWLDMRDVRRPAVADPPPEVDAAAGERWIDVDLATQTLVAYEGRRPVFATLVSTGKGRKGSPRATPPGTYRIWAKLLTSDMDNLEDENAAGYYRMEDVPYVQYFSNGVALHGAFWHRSFGHVRSHGCVNLSPLDAQRLFWWTSPRLPAGWTAVLPAAHEPGTVVRVR